MKSGKGKPPSLKGIYYRTFVSLVAIPLLMVFIGTMFVINHQIRKASLENISTFQEGLADTLKQEIDENIYPKSQLHRISLGKSYGRISNKSFVLDLSEEFGLDFSKQQCYKLKATYDIVHTMMIIQL